MTSKLTRERLSDILEFGSGRLIKPISDEEIELMARMALAAMDSEPVAVVEPSDYVTAAQLVGEGPARKAVHELYEGALRIGDKLYRHAQPAPERDQVRREHAEWSQTTFGNVGPVGPLKHLSKEALEAAAEPGDLSEWADMQFLLWDAQRRAGVTDEQITQAMIEKLAVNKQRSWPEPKDGEPRLHIKEQQAPVAQCPYPCGWDTLNKLAIQDAAFVALALVAGEPATESIRSAVISNNDRLLKVISFCRDMMPQSGNSPVIGIDLASGPDRTVEVHYVAPPGYVMVPKEPTEAMMLHNSGCQHHAWDDPDCAMRQTRRLIWSHMLAAAPQEVK